jgi:arylsulfatase A-like enzyme
MLLEQFQADIDDFVSREELFLLSNYYADLLLQRDFTTFSQAEFLLFWKDYGPPASLFFSRLSRSNRLGKEAALNQKYLQRFPRGVPNSVLAYFTLEQAIDWLVQRTQTTAEPYCGYFHLLPPHHPYTTRADFIDRFQDGWQPPVKPESLFSKGTYDTATLNEQRRHYDEFICYVDAEFSRLFEQLHHNGALENTYLIFTSDHGELFERGLFMHSTPALYEAITHIPLIIWPPGQSQRVDIHTPTSSVDLLPTLLSLASLPTPEWCQGQPLPTFGAPGQEPRPVFAMDAKINSKFTPLTKGSFALYLGTHKLTGYFGYEEGADFYEFYDLEQDPHELNDLYPLNPSLAMQMQAELAGALENSNQAFSAPSP